MRILLIGEYSNVHNTLAHGLRKLGCEVTVVSNGDFWKGYPRDIDVSRRKGKLGGLALLARIHSLQSRLRGYDIVQIVNPMFMELRAERLYPIFKYLRRHNGHVVLGAFGMDYYWVHENVTRKPLRYSDFNIGSELRTNADAMRERADWLGTAKEELNKRIASEAELIVTGLYEYDVCYRPNFPEKTHFIPFPIRIDTTARRRDSSTARRLKVFIGINRERSEYKGTDIMLAAAEAVRQKHADRMELRIAKSVPFAQYQEMMEGADAIMDQLYSYTPAMNALLAMSKGIICIGGGEEESYQLLGERELRPIVNVQPTYESVYHELEQLVMHPERVDQLQAQSVEYVRRHHDYIKVAGEYLAAYEQLAKG